MRGSEQEVLLGGDSGEDPETYSKDVNKAVIYKIF